MYAEVLHAAGKKGRRLPPSMRLSLSRRARPRAKPPIRFPTLMKPWAKTMRQALATLQRAVKAPAQRPVLQDALAR